MHLTKTSSTAGTPVLIVKKPIEPNMAIEMVNFIIAEIFIGSSFL
ncbi:hypothetical protein [Ureibacillus manganicus]|nr:hypothetical protein [Ureibacillus manganicus]